MSTTRFKHSKPLAKKIIQKVAKAIRELVKESQMHPFDINNGQCEDFAEKLIGRLALDGIEAELEDDGESHIWTRVGNRVFDAEEPYGQLSYKQLPFFCRKRASRNMAELECIFEDERT